MDMIVTDLIRELKKYPGDRKIVLNDAFDICVLTEWKQDNTLSLIDSKYYEMITYYRKLSAKRAAEEREKLYSAQKRKAKHPQASDED